MDLYQFHSSNNLNTYTNFHNQFQLNNTHNIFLYNLIFYNYILYYESKIIIEKIKYIIIYGTLFAYISSIFDEKAFESLFNIIYIAQSLISLNSLLFLFFISLKIIIIYLQLVITPLALTILSAFLTRSKTIAILFETFTFFTITCFFCVIL